MRKMARIFLAIVAFVISAQGVNAQTYDIWDLERCIKYALDNNLQIKGNQLAVEQGQNDLLQAQGNMFPTLNGSASNQQNFGRSINPFTNTFENQKVSSNIFSLNLGFNVFSGFQTQNNIKAQRLNLIASELDLKAIQNNISLQVANAYLQVLFTYEIFEINKSQLLSTHSSRERTEKLVTAGSLSLDNLYTLKAQEATDELNLINSENSYKLGLLALEQLLQLKHADNFRIARPSDMSIPAEIIPSLENIYSDALSKQPQIKRDEVLYKASLASLKSAKGGMYPRLFMNSNISSLYSSSRKDVTGVEFSGLQPVGFVGTTLDTVFTPSYKYLTQTTPFSRQLDQNFGQTLGFSLSIPIFNNFSVRNTIVRSKINTQRSLFTLEQSKNQLYQDVTSSFLNYKASKVRYEANQKNKLAQQESFKYAQVRFDQGLMNATDFIIAQNRLLQADANLAQAKYESIFRYRIVVFYQGNTITLK